MVDGVEVQLRIGQHVGHDIALAVEQVDHSDHDPIDDRRRNARPGQMVDRQAPGHIEAVEQIDVGRVHRAHDPIGPHDPKQAQAERKVQTRPRQQRNHTPVFSHVALLAFVYQNRSSL